MRSNTSYSQHFLNQKRTGTYPKGMFRKVSGQKMFERNDPRYYRRNLEHIAAIAKQRGVQTVLTSFAYCELKDDPLVSEEFEEGH